MSDDGPTSRREFLAFGAALAAAGCGQTETGTGTTMTTTLTDLSAADAIAAMQKGEIGAESYANALLQRAAALSHLNAFRNLQPEQVLEAALRADQLRASGAALPLLHGLPVPVKDSVNTRDYPTTGGTPALQNFVPAEDAALVQRLRAAGAIVMGKTSVHELSFGWTSNNRAFGAVRNPYDPTRIPGGSSGGTAAAVAARMAPLGIAEDTQGSIRVPAAMCGIAGFRPTQNRYPNQGVVPITPLFDQVGPQARDVGDIALFDHAITGTARVSTAAPLAGVRLGVPREYFYGDLDSGVGQITADALQKLADAGVVLVEADVPDLKRLIDLTTAQVQLYHVMPMLTNYLDEYDTGVSFDDVMAAASADIRETFAKYVLPGGEFSVAEEDFIAARDVHLPALRQTLAEYFRDNRLAAMIFPAAQIPAPPIGHDRETTLNGRTVPFEAVISRNISPGSTGGIPGLVLPAGLNGDGLPVCLELDGPAGSDRALLGIGLGLETVLGKLPPPAI